MRLPRPSEARSVMVTPVPVQQAKERAERVQAAFAGPLRPRRPLQLAELLRRCCSHARVPSR